jgi:hypothetical protein
MKTYQWILTIVLVLSLSLPTMTASAQTPTPLPRSASMSLTSPAPNPVLIGGEVTFDLIFSVANIDPGVSGAEVYLGYDPILVGPSATPGVGTAEVRPEFFGASNVSINELLPAANCPGKASPCVHLVLAGPAQTTQTGVAVRFHFRSLVEGTACFGVLQSSMSDANGYDVSHVAASDQCVPIQSRTVTGTVLRQGVPANPNPGGGTFACAGVSAIGTWTFGPFNTNSTGRFNMVNLPTGVYTFRVIYPGYLTAEKTGVTVAGNSQMIDIGTTTLRGGDVNGDNAINILDIGAIISRFGRTGAAVKSASASCGGDESADINDDGLVNISDLAIAAGNWGSVGPKVWP